MTALASASVAAFVAAQMLTAAVVLTAAFALTRAASDLSAAVRHGVWALAMGCLLALPLADRMLPSVRVPVPFDLPGVAADAGIGPEAPVERAPGSAFGVSIGSAVPGERTAAASPANAPDAVRPPMPRIDWPSVLLLVWLVGVVAGVCRLAAFGVGAGRLAAEARRVGVVEDGALVASLARRVGVLRTVRVYRTPGVAMPVAWGVVRPIVLLPGAAVDWSPRRREIVLLHELAHIARWDYLTSLVADVACSLYWPVPIVRSARRRLREEQERACDDRVLATGAPPVEYADHLLAVARAFYGERRQPALGVSMAREAGLKQRVRAILDEGRDRRPLRCGPGTAAVTALFVVVPSLAAIDGVEPRRPPSPEYAGPARASEPVSTRAAVASATAPPARPPTRIWIEAEAGVGSRGVEVDTDLAASGARYAVLAADRDSDRALEYRVNVPAGGAYRVWVRLSGRSEPLPVFVGGRSASATAPGRGRRGRGSWNWVVVEPFAADSADEDGAFRLEPGPLTVAVHGSDTAIRVDRLLITDDLSYEPVERGPGEAAFQPSYRVIEAESGGLAGRAAVRRHPESSGGRYVRFEDAARRRPEGSVSFRFDVDRPGRYIVWGRVHAPDTRSNSFFVSVNGGPEVIWDAPSRSLPDDDRGWAWDPISARGDGDAVVDPVVLDLPAGANVLTLRTREDDVALDAILVTNDLAHRPRGLWPETLPTTPVHIGVEAEDARIEPPLSVRPVPGASGGFAVVVGELPDEPAGPGDGGIARHHVTLPVSGLYTLWARAKANRRGDDSLWLRVDSGDWIRWSDVPRTDGWTWSAVHHSDDVERIAQFVLEAGAHLIEFAGRESEVMIDRILITNDPLFDPETLP